MQFSPPPPEFHSGRARESSQPRRIKAREQTWPASKVRNLMENTYEQA